MTKKWQVGLLVFIVFLSFAFAGGGTFLLFGMVPLEQALTARLWTQQHIDRFLSVFVVGWFVFAGLVAWLYYHLALKGKGRPWPARLVPIFTSVSAGAMFLLFLNTHSSVIAARSGPVDNEGQVTFGPYPDLQTMRQLKEEGYDGIISLLSPAVPFEGPLLEKEAENAKQAGIEIYSLPMLPWISDNRASLERARELLKVPNKRYYVHCYLGRHRTQLVKQIANQLQRAPEPEMRPPPDRLERGIVLSYDNGKILLAPFPTDEEWVARILSRGFSEIISVIEAPGHAYWLEKLQQMADLYGARVIPMPLDPVNPDPAMVKDIAAYARKAGHRVFIVGIRHANWTWAVDTALGGSDNRPREPLERDKLERGQLLRAGDMLFGPFPTDEEVAVLRRAGFAEFVSVLDAEVPQNGPWMEKEREWAKRYGFSYRHFQLPRRKFTASDLVQITDYVSSRKQPVYVHSFTTDSRLEILHKLAQQRLAQVAAAAGGGAKAQTQPAPATGQAGASTGQRP